MESSNNPPQKSFGAYLTIAVFVGSLILLCAICLGGGLLTSRYAFPNTASTRTALAELFLTVTPLVTPSTVANAEQALPTPTIYLQPAETQAQVTPTFAPPIWLTPPPGKIVYVCFDGSFDQICLMNGDGGGKVQLTWEDATSFYPSLSPGGEQIVFSSRRDGNFEIYSMNIDGSDVTQLTDNIGSLYAPEISPNGKRIVFTIESGGKQEIWIMKVDGSNARPVSSEDSQGIDPTWSPEGDQIAFASKRGGSTQIHIINSDGTKLRQITRGLSGIGGRSSWSPDGEWLAFYAGPEGNRNIFLIGVDGKDLRQLTDGGDNLGPSFSPDGEWIAFTSFRDGNNEIYVMHTDGSHVTRMTGDPLSDWQPRWGR